MKKAFFALLIISILISCGVNQQIKQLKALEKCKYTIASADSVYLGNIAVSSIITPQGVNLSKSPVLALALFKQHLPFTGRLNLKIENPGNALAGINRFEYIVLIKDFELTKGVIDQPIRIEPNGGSTIVPIKISTDIYPIIENSKNRAALINFFNLSTEKEALITFKIKPSLTDNVEYPGYITFDKGITNKKLVSSIRDAVK
ncbi:hypothetical protein [Rubrolithibacter danxiaensis]|uniref:hypothetical protein n=1 Tax=Rubrolithibacter danxiaensis TaxID=3390805 RepID=UPI003BF87C63